MLEGRAHELTRQRRFAAEWMAPLLTATSGQCITPAQLLGEEPAQQSIEQRVAEGEKKLAALQRKMKRKQRRQ